MSNKNWTRYDNKIKDQIISEEMDLEGPNPFKIFKQYLQKTADDERRVRNAERVQLSLSTWKKQISELYF